MSRIRTVKPELFKHEDLFDAEVTSGLPLRLAFIGLFTVADREGRFRWKPRTLKLDVLPHDAIDFAAVMNALESAGFIRRYEVNSEAYGWIPTFTKHQRFSGKEAELKSELPPPPEGSNGEATGKQWGSNGEAPEYFPGKQWGSNGEATGKQTGTQEEEGKGKEGKGLPGREEKKTHAREEATSENGKTRQPMQADWQPGQPALDILAQQGIPSDFAQQCIPEFRLYWQERGDARPGWDASFVNSVRRSWDHRPPGQQKVLGQRRPGQTIAERITEEHALIFGASDPDPFRFAQPAEPRLIEGEVEHVH